MRLFLTGGTGFIGSHVLAAALDAGHDVVALRRSSNSVPVIPLHSQPQWCQADLYSLESSHLDSCDAVIHLASAGVSPKRVSWDMLVQCNVAGSVRILELAALAGVPRIVVSGTSHEYGNVARRYHAIPPQAPLEPINPYGASKAAAYLMLRCLAVQLQLELVYARIFNAYGIGQYEANFWPSLLRAAQSGCDFQMTSGRQVTDFIPVTDVADHLLLACSRPDVKPANPLVVNVGSGTSVSLLDFAYAEWKRLGAVGRLLPDSLPSRPDQIDRTVPDLVGLQVQPSIPSKDQ
jgi:UDP-glucose 4-epimerase